MYLIAYDCHTHFIADFRNLYQYVAAPAYTGRVVRVAQNHKPATFKVTTQCIGIQVKSIVCPDKAVAYDQSSGSLWNNMERMIYRILYQNPIRFFSQALYCQKDARYDARYVIYLFLADIPVIMYAAPVDNTLII